MYFRDFQAPEFDERFNGEWGAIRGMPPGWVEKQPEEVRRRIEELAHVASLTRLEKEIKVLRTDVEALKRQVLIEFEVDPIV